MGNSTSGSGVVNRNLKTKLERGEPAYGLWVTLESPAVTEIATELQLDFVVIELEHSALGANDVVNHLNAARGGKTTVLARLPVGSRESIKIALDIGVANANDDILVIPIIETVEALEDIDKILAVPGLEAIFIGPSDLSAAQGHVAVWEGPGVADQILSICQAAREQGIAYGIITLGPEDLKLRREQGYQMLAFGMDTAILVSGIRAALAAAGVGSDSSPHVSGGYGVAAAAAPE
jgi:2-keto-3-deoxy-L-rhamnonate aldolase RhmA